MIPKPDFPFRRRHEKALKEYQSRQQIAIAKRQVKVALALNWVTGAAALFAFLSVIGVIWSVKEARRATIEANRAWIGLDGPIIVDEFVPAPVWGIALRSTLRNYGHGPALKIISTLFLTDDAKSKEGMARFVCESSEHFSTGTIPMTSDVVNPGPLGHVLFPDQRSNISDPFDPQKPFVWHGAGALTDGAFVSAIGCVAYLDQFEKPHWTRFCMQGGVSHGQLVQWDYCNLYNDTDETGRHQSDLYPLKKKN